MVNRNGHEAGNGGYRQERESIANYASILLGDEGMVETHLVCALLFYSTISLNSCLRQAGVSFLICLLLRPKRKRFLKAPVLALKVPLL